MEQVLKNIEIRDSFKVKHKMHLNEWSDLIDRVKTTIEVEDNEKVEESICVFVKAQTHMLDEMSLYYAVIDKLDIKKSTRVQLIFANELKM